MKLEDYFRVILLGIASWAIPFGFSVLLYGPSGALFVSGELFDSLMTVAGGASAAGLLVIAFRRLPLDMVSGFLVGVCWASVNLLLDDIILLPMMHVSEAAYVADIGLRYALLPILGATMGAAARDRSYARWQAARTQRRLSDAERFGVDAPR
jgi:hypothetical protein